MIKILLIPFKWIYDFGLFIVDRDAWFKKEEDTLVDILYNRLARDGIIERRSHIMDAYKERRVWGSYEDYSRAAAHEGWTDRRNYNRRECDKGRLLDSELFGQDEEIVESIPISKELFDSVVKKCKDYQSRTLN